MANESFTRFLLNVALSACFSLPACKKEENNYGESNFIAGKWKMTACIHNGLHVYNTQVPPCITDNVITFTADQKMLLDEGPTKCSTTDPQTGSGTYSFNSGKTQLTTVTNGSSDVFNVQTLSSTALKLQQVSNGDVVTYSRQ